MLTRFIAVTLLWGIQFSLVWLVAHEYFAFVDEKLTAIARALSTI